MNKRDIPQHVAASAKLMEAEIEKWHKNPEDSLFVDQQFDSHYERCNYTNSLAVADDGLRIYNLVVGKEDEAGKDTVIDGLIRSTTYAAGETVFRSLSLALGVSERSLRIVLEDYVEGDRTDAMGMAEFARQVAQTEAEAKAEGKPSGPRPRP